VEIHVLQGEREMAAGNKTLGKFHLTDIPPAPRGIPMIEVTFDIDANGIVNVSAKDKGTGKEQKITISGSTALSDSEVDRMVTDAEAHAEEDAARKAEVEVRNTAESLTYATEKTMTDLGEKVPEETKTSVSAAIDDLKKALEGSDIDEIKAKTEALQQASYKLAEIVYADAQAEAGAAEGATSGAEGAADSGSGDEVVEAEYEVVEGDEDK
jgi:molecular chaperone DnaK